MAATRLVTVGSVSREAAAERFDFPRGTVLRAPYRDPGAHAHVTRSSSSGPTLTVACMTPGRATGGASRRAARGSCVMSRTTAASRGAAWPGAQDGSSWSCDRLPEALAAPGPPVTQFARGLEQAPVPMGLETLVIGDNGDLYGTYADLVQRARECYAALPTNSSCRRRTQSSTRPAGTSAISRSGAVWNPSTGTPISARTDSARRRCPHPWPTPAPTTDTAPRSSRNVSPLPKRWASASRSAGKPWMFSSDSTVRQTRRPVG